SRRTRRPRTPPRERALPRLLEQPGDHIRVVSERPASPCPEDEGAPSMPGGDGKDPADPPPHHGLDLSDPRPDVPPDAVRVYRGRREDRAPPRLVQQPVVVAENGHVGR